MNESAYVCANCGNDTFVAEGSVVAWRTGIFDQEPRPLNAEDEDPIFFEDGDQGVDDWSSFEREGYSCDNCGKSGFSFDKLIITREEFEAKQKNV